MSQADSADTTILPKAHASLDLDALSSAWLHFTALADELPACPHRDVLRLAADIASSLSTLRSDVTQVIVRLDEGKLNTIDAARELRRAKLVAAGGDDASRS